MASKYNRILVCFLGLFLMAKAMQAQDTAVVTTVGTVSAQRISQLDSTALQDSLSKRRIKRTTVHAAILPGWGQIDNRQYWKLPLVYAAVGIPAYLFFYNLSTYQELKQAYIYRLDDDPANDDLVPDKYKPLSDNSIRFYRDEFRRNVDYSALAFLIAWGLQVVDANVSAHLKDFDVSDNLTMRIRPTLGPMARSAGVGLVLRPKPSSGVSRNVSLYTR